MFFSYFSRYMYIFLKKLLSNLIVASYFCEVIFFLTGLSTTWISSFVKSLFRYFAHLKKLNVLINGIPLYIQEINLLVITTSKNISQFVFIFLLLMKYTSLFPSCWCFNVLLNISLSWGHEYLLYYVLKYDSFVFYLDWILCLG